MKILVITPSFLPVVGGLEFAVHYLSHEWGLQGHTVVVANTVSDAVSIEGSAYQVKKIKLVRGGDRFGWHRFPFNAFVEYQLRKIINTVKPDFISAHFAYPCGIWMADISPHIPWAVTCHARDVQVLEAYNYGYRLRYKIDNHLKIAFEKTGKIITVSHNIRSIVKEFGIPDHKIIRIPNGADIRLRDLKSKVDIRKMIQIPEGAPYVLSVGTNYFAKGFDAGIEAFADISSRHPNVFYFLLGAQTNLLAEMASKLGIAGRIRTCEKLTGDDLRAAYQQAILYFSPSRTEGFSLACAEALMAGLPILATDCKGNQEIVQNGINGLLCPVDDKQAMSSKLDKLLGDESLRLYLRNASQSQSCDYEWPRIAGQYISIAGELSALS